MISFACPSCGQTLKVKPEFSGKRGKCPHCKAGVQVPGMARAATGEAGLSAGSDQFDVTRVHTPGTASDRSDTSASGPRLNDPSLTEFLAPPEAPGELGRLGGHRILRVLGRGGMGIVFLAEEAALKRAVAIKALPPGASVTQRQRFFREAQAAAAIEHDHIVSIYQVGEDRGTPFIVMQLLKGQPLDERLADRQPLPVAEVLRIGRETALGLAAAHAGGLIHRDIKPANLWLEADTGRVKILDFGLARGTVADSQVTQDGAIMGTPAFMAPEQATGREVDSRADLFSLGVVLYRLSTGQLPFTGPDAIATLLAVSTVQPPEPREVNPALPAGLSQLIMRLLSKSPADRPQSAREVADALDALQRDLAAGVTSPFDVVDLPAIAPPAPSARMQKSAAATSSPRLRKDKSATRSTSPNWTLFAAAGGGGVAVLLLLVLVGRALFGSGGAVPEKASNAEKKSATKTKLVAKVDREDPPPTEEPPPSENPEAAANRKAAVWVLDKGGKIGYSVLKGGSVVDVGNANALPKQPFWVVRIELNNQPITDEEFAVFEGLREVEKLRLSSVPIRGGALQFCRGMTGLRELELFNSRLTDQGLEHIHEMRALRRLNLAQTQITDVGLNHLSDLVQLEELDLSGTTCGRTGLTALRGMTALRNLALGHGVTDQGLESLSGLRGIENLRIQGRTTGSMPTRPGKFKNPPRPKGPNYTELALTDAGLAHLKDMTAMRFLLLIGAAQVTDAGLEHLAGMTRLQNLIMPGSGVTGKGLEKLKGCTELRQLVFDYGEFTDEGLPFIKQFPSLNSLNLAGTQVTDAGLEHLMDARSLRNLMLQRTEVSDEAIRKFREARPMCMVRR